MNQQKKPEIFSGLINFLNNNFTLPFYSEEREIRLQSQ